VAEFRYLTASEWNMRWARPPIGEKLLDAETYVHHSAGGHVNNAITAFQALNEYAINTKGYSALDYDILVHRDQRTGLVTIGEGRGQWMSAATLDRNEQGEAICLLGYFHPGHTLSRQPHPDELEGVARGIVWGIAQGWIAATTSILGHRDNPAHPGATGCPGDYLQAKLPWIRDRVAQLLDPSFEEPVMKPILWRPTGYQNVFIVTGADAIHASTALIDAYGLNVKDIINDPHPQTLKSILHVSGLTEADLVR
jgi:hypothetical protein